MWTDTKSKEAHDALVQNYLARKEQLRARFQAERIGDADLQLDAAKLFQPITSEAIQLRSSNEQANKQLEKVTQALTSLSVAPAAATINPIASLMKTLPAPEKSQDPTLIVNADKGLDIETIKKHNFLAPSELDLSNDETVDTIVTGINYINRYVLGPAKKRAKTAEVRDAKQHEIDALSKYRERLRTLRKSHELVVEPQLAAAQQQRSGSGLKMKGNRFGTLSIDPIALQAGKLQAYDGGNLVFEAPADASLHDLLTKRFVKTKQYSPLAVDTFKKLVELAGLPIHGRKSKKHRLFAAAQQHGGAVQYYNDPEQLVERLQLLIASKQAGNTGVDNEISAILDELMRTGAIPKDLCIQLNKTLLSV